LHVFVFTQVPSKGGKGSERQLAWVFEKSNADTMALMGLVTLPMLSSAIFRKMIDSDPKGSKDTKTDAQTGAAGARKATDSAAQEDADNAMDAPEDGDHTAASLKRRPPQQSEPAEGNAGQQKKKKEKSEKAARKGAVDKEEIQMFSPMMQGRGADTERPKTALDDFMCAMDFAICKVAKAYQDAAGGGIQSVILARTKGFCASLFLEFLFNGMVSVNGKMFRIWSALRLELQHVIISTHGSIGSDSGEMDPLELAEKICSQFVNAPVLTMVGDDDEEEVVNRIMTVSSLRGKTVMEPLAAFVKDQLNLPLWMHAAPQHALLGAKETSLETLDLVSFMVLIQEKLMHDLPPSWVAFARDVSECFASHGHFIDKTAQAEVRLQTHLFQEQARKIMLQE
jgi:hypothetical protein